ncbi:HGL338Cp [Eremothecium sinecaudum]|uniref:alpha-1,2-Mannosidase n=1 Tax=Eremothecium sinecaudum TaxID=45286 RepID=A0A0X8HV28_9SACH|nr:HGL338Cp [Eremothecium sinecaudum]AMD22002.1 HGL338Cp [Eremothecium sinecaudum]
MVLVENVVYLFHLLQIVRLCLASERFTPFSFNRYELEDYKNEVRDLFYFAFDSYLTHGYPYDEVKPISCVPKTRNFTHEHDLITNDVLGNFTTTLVDSLSTIAILGDVDRFAEAVELVDKTIPADFSLDVTIQVFETTIRILGGLISAHLYATDPTKKVYLGPSYNNHLLTKAKVLADRLLPSYLTRTGIPVPRINLRSQFQKIDYMLVSENNAAAAASPMLEFTMLSYLTHDDKYREVTAYAFKKTWDLRSELNLLSMSFNPDTMEIYHPMTGTGASIDSFFEYALKGSILFDDSELYQIWAESYYALSIHAKADWFFYNVNTQSGEMITPWIDSLSAFFPGSQVLDGDVADAEMKHLMFLKLWNTYGGIPERWLFSPPRDRGRTPVNVSNTVQLGWYALRPEFVESTYFLYRATKDVFYLNIGWHILQDLKTRFKFECGFAGLQNVITGEHQDRMESFVLGETLKYLYLLFDESNELHKSSQRNQIFSTEAHPMWLTPKMKEQYNRNKFMDHDIYFTHLEHLKKLSATRRKGPPSFQDKVLGLLKLTLGVENTDEELDDELSKTLAAVHHPRHTIMHGTCPVLPKDKKLTFYHSRLLNDFPQLFRIDHNYAATLIKPKWRQNAQHIETFPDFYYRWYDRRTSVSQPAPLTASFEFMLDSKHTHPLPVKPTKQGNVYYFPTLHGCKLRVERIMPGLIDTYGDYISPKIFKSLCPEDLNPGACGFVQPPQELLIMVAIDGKQFPKDSIFVTDYDDLFGPHAADMNDILSYNKKRQLLINCNIVANVYVG